MDEERLREYQVCIRYYTYDNTISTWESAGKYRTIARAYLGFGVQLASKNEEIKRIIEINVSEVLEGEDD